MKILRYYRVEDHITISEDFKEILHFEVKTNPRSAFPIFFDLKINSILELRDYLNKIISDNNLE